MREEFNFLYIYIHIYIHMYTHKSRRRTAAININRCDKSKYQDGMVHMEVIQKVFSMQRGPVKKMETLKKWHR